MMQRMGDGRRGLSSPVTASFNFRPPFRRAKR